MFPWWIFGGLVENHGNRSRLARQCQAPGSALLHASLPVWPIEVSWVCWARAEVAAAALELAGGFGLAAFLLALLKAQPKDLAVGDAAAEGVDGYATLAQISATVRLLQREVQLA